MTDKPNEKSAGQLKYEKEWRGHPDAGPWDSLTTKAQQRWEWNASVTPKAQTIKAP